MYERVAVTGAAGGIGYYVVKELHDACDLRLGDINPGASANGISRVDICNLDSLIEFLRGCDAVVHLAAIDSASLGPTTSPGTIMDVNVRGTWNVLEAASHCGLRKSVIMSSEAGLGVEYLDVDPPPLYLSIDEAHPFRPSDTYGLSKQLCEGIGQNFARRTDMSIVCMRPTEVAFPWLTGTMNELVRLESTNDTRSVTRTSERPTALSISRAYIRPDDMARLIRLSLEVETDSYEVFWASAADTCSPMPTLPLIRSLYGSLPELRNPRFYERYPNAAIYDISQVERRLGWVPTGGWTEWTETPEAVRGVDPR